MPSQELLEYFYEIKAMDDDMPGWRQIGEVHAQSLEPGSGAMPNLVQDWLRWRGL